VVDVAVYVGDALVERFITSNTCWAKFFCKYSVRM
jgi:hypothetical protein